jgi:hypothetical protein
MVHTFSSDASKKIAFRFIQENIDYRKRCLYLQEIVFLSKNNDIWRRALAAFFDTPFYQRPVTTINKN